MRLFYLYSSAQYLKKYACKAKKTDKEWEYDCRCLSLGGNSNVLYQIKGGGVNMWYVVSTRDMGNGLAWFSQENKTFIYTFY